MEKNIVATVKVHGGCGIISMFKVKKKKNVKRKET